MLKIKAASFNGCSRDSAVKEGGEKGEFEDLKDGQLG